VAARVLLLNRLEQDRSLVREAGARARRAFEDHYDRPIGVARVLSILGLSVTSRAARVSCVAESAF